MHANCLLVQLRAIELRNHDFLSTVRFGLIKYLSDILYHIVLNWLFRIVRSCKQISYYKIQEENAGNNIFYYVLLRIKGLQ